jgi:hypothetical protein
MSLTVEQPSTSGTQPAAAQGWLRRHRGKILIVAALVVATTFVAIGGNGGDHTAALDPDNTDPGGARAVAQVLEGQGIEVDVVRSAAAFRKVHLDASSTVLITSPENLGRTTARDVVRRTDLATLVVVDPSSTVAGLFGADAGVRYSGTQKVAAACSEERFSGLRLETRTGREYPSSGNACFRLDGGSALLTEPAKDRYLLGAADVLANEQITSSDNAAIALRLLGNHDHLVWYVPDEADQSADDGVTFSSLLPKWLGPAMVLLCVSIVGLMYWRGRRFGTLAREPLPVTVTAIETTRSRARLYRKANDRGYAAEALRRDARTRLAAHLLLPRTSVDDVTALVDAAAPHTALDPRRITELLGPGGAATGTDKDLITLANDLAELIREVRRS